MTKFNADRIFLEFIRKTGPDARIHHPTPRSNAQATKIVANFERYEAVSKQTGVPWDVIAVIHPMHGR